MRGLFYLAILSTCILGVTVDAAILRPWRTKAKIKQDQGTSEALEGPGRPRVRKRAFKPTTNRCCKVGRKVAKRRMSCDVKVLKLVRLVGLTRAKLGYNRPRKLKPSKVSARLSNKIGMCLDSFPKWFNKCCAYREQYYSSMNKCKKRPGSERKKCRLSIRKRYKQGANSRKKKKKS